MMNSRTAFVTVGLAVNLFVLLRGVVFMTELDYAALGLIALVQSVVLFVGMLHFGLLNGGYRLLCHAGPAYRQRIVNLAWTLFAGIALLIAVAAAIAAVALDDALYRAAVGLTALGGVCTLLRAWMMNEMVAAGRLKALNISNAISVAASLAVLPFLGRAPALLGIVSIVVQPVLFVLAALIARAVLRPTKFKYNRRLGRLVFRAGFILFLAGLSVQVINQMERWYVGGELGLDQLGRLYLAFLFLTLFQMTPNLLEQVFLPGIVRARKRRDDAGVRREMRHLLLFNIAYGLATIVGLALLAEPVLNWLLPKYLPDLRWVYLLAPGLIVFALSGPFAIVFNAVIDYTWYLIAYGLGTLATALAFGTALATGYVFGLDQIILLRDGVYTLMALAIVIGWWKVSARHREFRLFGKTQIGLVAPPPSV